jgi:flagellar motor protein MotB
MLPCGWVSAATRIRRGIDQHNQGLSERRVNVIRDVLVKAGVASDKIQISAFGAQKPLCNESTDPCWQRDRRVDVGFRTGKERARSITLAEQVSRPER